MTRCGDSAGTFSNPAWEEAERLNHLVGNLLNMTRLEAGAITLALEACDVQDLVGVTLTQMANRLRHRQLVMDVPGALPPVMIDLVLTAQALVNLVDNALKFSPADSPIGIRAYLDQRQVVIEISDEGIGIPPSELEHVFDKFYRVQQVSDTGGTAWGINQPGHCGAAWWAHLGGEPARRRDLCHRPAHRRAGLH